jgi:hypothetical protein
MNPSIRRLPATGTLGALLTLAATLSLPAPALAQKSLGAGSGSGPVMTREELRTCLKQQVALKERVELFERDTGSLEREKADILVAQKALDAERGGVVADANKISAVNARAADLSKRIDEWNERWQAFEKEGRTGPFADRQRRKLLDEQREMKAEEADLAAERDKLSGITKASEAFDNTVAAFDRSGRPAGACIAQQRRDFVRFYNLTAPRTPTPSCRRAAPHGRPAGRARQRDLHRRRGCSRASTRCMRAAPRWA